jgi:CAAX protease family protein
MSNPELPRPVPEPSAIPNRGPGADRAWWAGRRHPVWTAAAVVAAPIVLTVVVAVVGRLLFPAAGDNAVLLRRLAAVVLVAVVALAVVGRANAWRRTGAAGPITWRHVALLTVPTLVALAPLATGLNPPAVGMLAVLILGYVATGVFEELWHRGVVLDTLRSVGLRRSAVIGGAFFAASHLANIVFGQAIAVSLAQAVGAFCFGIGFSVFRWRTNAVWLLAGIHALGDLMFKITNLHGGMLWVFLVGHDILMLLWGLWCLRGVDNDVSDAPTENSN